MDLYSSDTAKAWKSKLVSEWYKIQKNLDRNHNIDLPCPHFEIVEKKWGSYHRNGEDIPTIHLCRHLFENFGWGSVIHVLKHETAHYIVDRAWNMRDLKPHGEAFVRACKILEVDDRRLSGIKDLLDEDQDYLGKEKTVLKIKKVMALTSSSEKGEAENALRKAQELMLKHNIRSLDEHKPEEYLFRPVGPVCKKMPNYVRDLGNMIAEFYFVNHILCYCGSSGRYYEFFGTKENLDIAEYIFCCVLRQAEHMWEEHAKELKKQYGGTRGIASKNCFIEGIVAGYSSKLYAQRKERDTYNSTVEASEALIWTGDPLLEEMYRKAYPNVRTYSYHHNARGGGYGAGFDKGKNLSFNAGIHSGNSGGKRGRLLNA